MAPSLLPGRRCVGVVAALALLIGLSVSGQPALSPPASAATGSEADPDPLPVELDEFESTWQVTGGVFRLTTLIPMGGQ